VEAEAEVEVGQPLVRIRASDRVNKCRVPAAAKDPDIKQKGFDPIPGA
jgi:hypothetical protein